MFVTGRLAAPALQKMVDRLAAELGFSAKVEVLPITVAALMSPKWISGKLDVRDSFDRIILPGYCQGDFDWLQKQTGAQVEIGPRDFRKLPQYFGQSNSHEDYGQYDIEIIAEINHAARFSLQEVLALAKSYAENGADWIDIGCEVDGEWNGLGDCVQAVKELGLKVSVDSLNPAEISKAVDAGAELVLSINSQNLDVAFDNDAEFILIPDDPARWHEMESNIEKLEAANVRYRVDPIVEPIGFGFAASLQRYFEARERWPETPMMMGIGNLTEMTEVDSAGINMLLISLCQELAINSVLTTQVIPWAQSAVRECDIARRLAWYSFHQQVTPKHIDSRLVMLRDPQVASFAESDVAELAEQIRDWNYRILIDQQEIHLLGGRQHIKGTDPFKIFDELAALQPKNLTPDHAFYLGYEMCKAMVAMNLGKEYVQDEALNWGFLTVDESNRHRLSKRRVSKLADDQQEDLSDDQENNDRTIDT